MGKGQKLKIILKNILKAIFYIVFVFITNFIIIFLTANALINLKIINTNTAAIITLCLTFISTLAISIIHYTKKAKAKNVILKIPNFVKYYILYIIVMDLLISVKPSVEINIEEAKNLLSIEFALFAILTALVVTWCVITEKEVSKSKENTKPFGLEERISKVLEDYKKNIAAKNYFWDIIPFAVSLLFISYITTNVLINKKIDLTTQTLLYYNLQLLLNSMIILIIDILTPTITKLFMQKKELVDDKLYNNETIIGMVEDKVKNLINETCLSDPKFKNLPKQSQDKIKSEMLEKCEPEMNKIILEITENNTKNED